MKGGGEAPGRSDVRMQGPYADEGNVGIKLQNARPQHSPATHLSSEESSEWGLMVLPEAGLCPAVEPRVPPFPDS